MKPVPESPPISAAAVAAHDGPVLYIADAPNRLERKLLETCLAPGGEVNPAGQPLQRVFLDLSERVKSTDFSQLEERLKLPGNALLVPVRMAWAMPQVEKDSRQPLSLRHLVLGDPRRPGPLRGRWLLNRDPERARCMIGAAATLDALHSRFRSQQLSPGDDSPGAFAAFVARQAALALEIAEWGQIGRRYKVPRFVSESLRGSAKFKTALRQLADETGRPLQELEREAAGYMEELIATPDPLFVDLRARFDQFMLALAYDKDVVCREEDLKRVREVVSTRPAMLLFTHKTYLDSVALTAKMFEFDFPMLHIFAGANMGFAGLGMLMRRSGGIFIRRSFQDKPLYKVVLRHYIGYLMEKRFPMTWAFEGTRSRTGKLMPPRYGLLKYVLEAAHATDARDIHVIPVTVSYDLMRDVEEYASEQIGRVKAPESLKWFVGYLSSLRQPMGRMYLDFGDSVVLEHAPEPDDSLALSKIAFEVAVQSNRVAPITLPAIACMVLLGAAPRALTLRELQREILRLVRWARDREIRLTSDFRPERLGHVKELSEAMAGMELLIRYDEGSDTVFGIEPASHPMASYYRNTIIHHFVNKAILELALLAAADARPDSAREAFWAETERLRDFFKFEFFYPEKAAFRQELEGELTRACPDWSERLGQGGAGVLRLLEDMRPLVAHASLLQFIEAYSVVFDLLARLPAEESFEESDCVSRAIREGKQAYLQRRITSEASIGKILFGNGYKLAANLGLAEGDSSPAGVELQARRIQLLRDFKELSRRLDRIRLMALAEEPAWQPPPTGIQTNAAA
jgi:glycerol-3-phosphate O-acyltransferase